MSDTYRNIVVGSDGSATAQAAVAVAASLAKSCGARLTVATAWYRKTDGPSVSEEVAYHEGSKAQQEATWAAEVVSDAAAIARSIELDDVDVKTPQGAPADGLIKVADELDNAMIVVGTVGLDSAAERLLGNVPHQLTHHAHSDVFLVSTGARQAPVSWSTVGLATDGSGTARIAVEHGLALARALGATPVLTTVARDEDAGNEILENASNDLGNPEGLEREVLVGKDPSQGLIDGAGRFDLLVIGNKGMSGPSRLLGSVSNRVTHHSPTDLLLVNTSR